MRRRVFLGLALAMLAGCANQAPTVPYPAFLQAEAIPDSFLAGLPGTTARIFASDAHTRSSSMLLQLPPDWNFGTGAALDKTLEIYVLKGDVSLGEFVLQPGGYAFLPAGSMGSNMSSKSGALMLYFLDEPQHDAVIQTPIISNSNLLDWQVDSDGIDGFGITSKELRNDPGSGARTWIMKIEPGAIAGWRHSSTLQEGYLVAGEYRHSECVAGEVITGDYAAGGYFLRPAGAVNGGSEAAALHSSVWLLRVPQHGTEVSDEGCVAVATN